MTTDHRTLIFNSGKRFSFPCLSEKGTQVFAPTADQRFLAGSDEFLRTHFPIQLKSRSTGLSTIVSEQDLLRRLLRPDPTVIGNRVFILYGAAGSGKSELLRWLQIQVSKESTERATVSTRISRTELDLLHIMQRLQHMLGNHPFQPKTLKRWEECRQKPRTLAKLLVLTALEQLLYSDDQINALYYQLIDIVQTNLERCFAAMSQPEEDIGQFVELFSREDLTELRRTSAIPVPLEYETLRYTMLRIFRDQLLEGADLRDTLKRIAQYVYQERQQRPLLLIDDLVQSINLFASDLLDYFITLEEGCWDVIVGITPNSLEATRRGKELLDRINYLDTIDDRVEKLWLSDEFGLTSSFLDERNCTEFARLYLSEYKRRNQRPCKSSCLAFHRCQHLDAGRVEDLLAPFNEEVLIRLFRSLPSGKGKVRYFTLYLREILFRVARGEDLLDVLKQYIKCEHAVYHPDKELAQVYELYGPLSAAETLREGNSYLEGLYHFFGIQPLSVEAQSPVIASLYKNHAASSHESVTTSASSSSIDAGKETIKSWLQGEPINKQQLRNVRRGFVKALKECYPLDVPTRLYTAKSSHILRWTQTRLDTTPPVQLEGVDEFDSLQIPRTIGPLSYLMHDFADAAGWIEQDLRMQILMHEAFPSMLFQGVNYRNRLRRELELQLGVTIEALAFSLLRVAMGLGYHVVELPLVIEEKVEAGLSFPQRYPESVEAERPRLTNGQLGMVRRLFDDCFKLRENVYDGMVLETMADEISQHGALKLLQSISPAKIASDFRLNEAPLGTFLGDIQAEIAHLVRLKADQRVRALLIALCERGLSTDDASIQLAMFLKAPGDNEQLVTDFLTNCQVFDLHQSLILAFAIDNLQYERSLTELRHLLSKLELETLKEQLTTRQSSKGFTKAEAEMLANFTRQGFRIPVSQVDMNLIVKIARHLPDLYKQLELRLQRG